MGLNGLLAPEGEVSREQKLTHLTHLYLKTVIKESHQQPLQQLAFCHTDGLAKTTLFATVGKDHATVYDDRHFGRHVDVVAQVPPVAPLPRDGANPGVAGSLASALRPHAHTYYTVLTSHQTGAGSHSTSTSAPSTRRAASC
jgi:hypothetical protein